MPALAGTAVLLAVTRRGAYVSPDGLAYVGTARNLVGGHGYTAPPGSPPVGNFAPLYMLLLAAVGALGPDPLTVARFAGPLLLGAMVLVVGLAARRLTASLPLAVSAQLLVLAGLDTLAYSSSALSEPLFVLLALLALVAVAPALERRRSGLLLAAALLAGAACVTRYVGLSVVAAGAASLVLLARNRGRHAWAGAIAFTAISLSPLFAWLAWVNGRSAGGTGRTAVYHPPGFRYLTDGARSASTWVVPDTVTWPARGVIAGLVVIGVGWLAWRRARSGAGRPAAIPALFALAYLGALLADRTWFDSTGRLDARFLLPVHVAAVILAVWALSAVDLRASHVARIGLSAVVGLQVAAGAVWALDAVTDPSLRPGGFTAPAWAHSEVIDQARAAPETATIYTNQVDALWFHTGKAAIAVPEKRVFLTGRTNPAYDAELAAMADGLRRGGLLVYFTEAPARRVFLPAPDELASRLGLQLVSRDAVGVALRSATRPTP